MKSLALGVTVGDGCRSIENFIECIDNGVSIFRFNLASSFVTSNIIEIYNNLNSAKLMRNISIEVLFDIPYPQNKIRWFTFNNEKFPINRCQRLEIVNNKNLLNSHNKVFIPYDLPSLFSAGDTVILGDGEISFDVLSVKSDSVFISARNNWFISSSKSISIPGKRMFLPSFLSPSFIDILNEYKPDIVALSFVENVDHINSARKLFSWPNIKICSKIESIDALKNIHSIVKESDLIIVARGDLALNAGIESMGKFQDEIIVVSNEYKKPVFVATELFASLKERPFPLRAEISDFYYLKKAILTGGFILTKESSMEGCLSLSVTTARCLLNNN